MERVEAMSATGRMVIRHILIGICLTGQLSTIDSHAQEVTSKAQKFCRDTAKDFSDLAVRAHREKLDPRFLDSQPSTGWVTQVKNYIYQAASQLGPKVTFEELNRLGYAYCIERRPSGW